MLLDITKKKKQHLKKNTNFDELSLQINEIIEKHLNIKENFHFVMNSTLRDDYFKKFDTILPFFAKHFDITRIPETK